MSTTLCQRVQQQFDPRIVDPWGIQLHFPSTLEHNFHAQLQDNMKKTSKNGDLGGWSFLQSLSNPIKNAQIENDKVYVHPLAERSKSALSEKSLEMCTESLGSETGSIISENEDDLMSSILVCNRQKSSRSIPCYTARKRQSITDLPPPLSTIVRSGSSCGVQVKSLREDGRLVLKAVSIGTPKTCFMAERRDGTLKLHMLHQQNDAFRDEIHQDFDDDHDESDDHLDHDDDETEGLDEIELDSFGQPSRCKDEGDRRPEMQNWKAIWVSTS